MSIEYEAYWMKPDNKVIPVTQRHITSIVTEPEKYGLDRKFIEKVHRKHKEPIGAEGNAREEIMAALIASGWIRARYVRFADSWTFQTRGSVDNFRVKKFCAFLLKHGVSIYTQAVVIDLSGFRLDGGQDTISEVAAGALERKRKVSRFAEFLNPAYSEKDLKFVGGRAIVRSGRNIVAKIYDRKEFFKGTKVSWSAKYPFSLEMSVGIKECVSLRDALDSLNRMIAGV